MGGGLDSLLTDHQGPPPSTRLTFTDLPCLPSAPEGLEEGATLSDRDRGRGAGVTGAQF